MRDKPSNDNLALASSVTVAQADGVRAMDNRALLNELKGTDCRCGTIKQPMKTFCSRCYYRLPKALQSKLYRRIGNGYSEAYQEAAKYLDARKPTVRGRA